MWMRLQNRVLFLGTESPEENSTGKLHRAATGQGDHGVKDECTQACRAGEGEVGTHLTCWVHSRPAWEAEAEFHAIPVPEQQVEHLRGQNPRAAPALLLASSQL